MRWMTTALLVGAGLILLAGCSGGSPSPASPSAQALGGDPTTYPASGGSTLVEPDKGATITLGGGAEVSVPPGALSQATVVSLREANSAPDVPAPRTILGPAYDLSLDGASLGSVAILKIPLPQGVTPEEYDVGAYRWNGRTWERVRGRLAGDTLQIATENPGTFALQGTWKLGSANLSLALPPGGFQLGMSSIPFTVTGEYRFAALPTVERGYTPVRLMLKRDSSGGAGQVTGDISLDQTVADTNLWFQPDPGQARGDIQFQHVFEISPGDLEVKPGGTSRYYAALQVGDSLAPTRQLSTGVDYTHVLPIRIVGRDVVRPDFSTKEGRPLQWQILLNGQPWQELASDKPTLPLDEVLARGGVGDYTITLESQSEGKWVTASNEVTVKLALPPTQTLVWTETPESTAVTGELPAVTTPTPGGPPPATPTRRPRPELQTPDVTPSVSPTPTVSATPEITTTRTSGSQVFWADSYSVVPGGCTVLHWNVQEVTAVYLDGEATTGTEFRRVCPAQTTTYVLRTVTPTGAQERRVTITVGNQTGAAIQLTADAYQVPEGGCTTLRWRAQGVRAVYLNDEGVAGEDTKQVCPTATKTYTLRVVGNDNTSSSRSVTIAVTKGIGIPLHFWADQYSLSPGECTNLNWSVDGVQAVYVGESGNEQGVAGTGSRRVCPVGRAPYTLRVTTADGRSDSRQLILVSEEPSLDTDEVIAQGSVREVVRTSDVNTDVGGDQPGYLIVIEGLNVLFSEASNCCQNVVTLRVAQGLIDQQSVFGVPIDWPINQGQRVEFRAACTGANCSLDAGPPKYLKLRSQ
jgi:hypothetical protein